MAPKAPTTSKKIVTKRVTKRTIQSPLGTRIYTPESMEVAKLLFERSRMSAMGVDISQIYALKTLQDSRRAEAGEAAATAIVLTQTGFAPERGSRPCDDDESAFNSLICLAFVAYFTGIDNVVKEMASLHND